MTNTEYDLLIKNALEKCLEAEFSDVPAEDEIEYEFSESYLKMKEKLIKRIGHNYFVLVNTTAKKIAVIAACIALIITSLLSVTAIREKIVGFFYEVFETYTSVVSTDQKETNNAIDTYYTISQVPDDYAVVSKFSDRVMSNIIFESSISKQSILLFQKCSSLDSMNLNSEDANAKESIINETPCLFIKQDLEYIYYWEFDGYVFTIHYPIELGEEFAQQVIGKLVEYKN